MNQMVDAFQKACYIEMLRGTPPPTWEGTCLNLEKKLADSRQHVTELEGRLRVLWDKLEGERKHYQERIKRLEDDYYDLIMQVERVFDGETRHQTAKRYIKNAECVILDSHKAKEAKP